MKQRKHSPELAPATISEADGVRYLHLGTPWVQGAMRIRKPQAIELDYVQRMLVWLLLRDPADWAGRRAVQLGLGAAALTRFCHGTLGMATTAVEINPTVIDACRIWFHLGDDAPEPMPTDPPTTAQPPLQVFEMDASQFAADPARAGSVDALCVDLYDHDAASPVLDDEVFYRHCARLLADGGVMTVNLFGRDASFERSAWRIEAAFGAGQVVSLRPTKEGNTIVAAIKQQPWPDSATLLARAKAVEAQFKLPARKWLPMIRSLPPQPLLTPQAPSTPPAPATPVAAGTRPPHDPREAPAA